MKDNPAASTRPEKWRRRGGPRPRRRVEWVRGGKKWADNWVFAGELSLEEITQRRRPARELMGRVRRAAARGVGRRAPRAGRGSGGGVKVDK